MAAYRHYVCYVYVCYEAVFEAFKNGGAWIAIDVYPQLFASAGKWHLKWLCPFASNWPVRTTHTREWFAWTPDNESYHIMYHGCSKSALHRYLKPNVDLSTKRANSFHETKTITRSTNQSPSAKACTWITGPKLARGMRRKQSSFRLYLWEKTNRWRS
jgi:hypothetical protein